MINSDPCIEEFITPPSDSFALPQRVLLADDDPDMRRLLEISLRNAGYVVFVAADGHELVRLAQEHIPHLVMVDLIMPRMDGYEAIRQMRNDTRISRIPMLILTGRKQPDEVVIGFETGADDYIAKPFAIAEVLARVRSHLRRAARQPLVNPLSGLPGGAPIAQELSLRLARHEPLAVLHVDIDNFKTFNDTYGFSRGDRAILLVATLLQAAIAAHGNSSDYIGHIGGDDFVLLTTPDRIDAICTAVVQSFDRDVRQFYPTEDLQRGYTTGIDRFGVLRRFKLLTLSIGGTTNLHRTFPDIEEMARVAGEMKDYAKLQPGSSYAIDQRSVSLPLQRDRWQNSGRQMLVASADGSLRTLLESTLQHAGLQVRTAGSAEELEQRLAHTAPQGIVADAQFGALLAAEHIQATTRQARPPFVLVLTYSAAESTTVMPGYEVLQMPLPLADVVTRIEQLLQQAVV
ncbi:MAG: response regulator [Roseiflexaceae bacterium]|nr:response regulator [Roseiflexaceae bacterium]